MWPFKRTLSERYSKLVKLIKSIDSHFQLTEDKEDSLRLHLSNYKGNQPMDFHIYLMEPFLFISFVTEIEGEKISCVNNFPKGTDQQDMFNVAMAANLEKIHQILDEKYNKNTEDNKADTKREKKKEGAKELTEEQRYALYYYVHSFTTPMYYNGNDNTPSLILRMYKKTLGLSDYDVEYIINTPLYRISEHIENLKSIDDTTTINTFLYSCVTIIDKAESGAAITNFLGIVQDLGISEEKLKDIIRTIEPTSCEHFFDRNNSDIWDNLDEEDTEELSSKTAQNETDGDASSDEVKSLNYFFDFDESYKKHILTIMALRPGLEFHYYTPKTHNPLWKYKGELLDSQNPNPIGCSAFAWIMQHYEEKEDFCYLLDFLGLDCMGKKYLDLFASTAYKDAEEMIYDIKRNVPSFKLGNDPQKVQPIIHQTWMDLIAIDNFIDYCSNSLDNLKGRNQSPKQLRDCSSIEDLALLFLLEFKVEIGCHSEKTEENTSAHNNFEEPAIVNSWTLLDFAKAHGKMKRVPSTSRINSETGEEEFSAAYCVFVHPTNKNEQGKPVITAIVAFSSELGELTAKEIGEQKDDLIVVEYESGNYSLKRKEIEKKENHSTEVTKEDYQMDNIANKIDNIKMIFCKYCGKSIEANSKFCIYCGKQLQQEVFVLKDFPNNIISALPVNSQEDLDEIISIGNENLVSGNYEKAYFYLREAARFGDAQSAFNTGLLLFNGNGVEKNEERAITFFMQAAEKGFIQAYNSIGVCFALGRGVPKDMSKAVSWYQKGADKGDKLAQNSLGRCYLIGDGVEKNLELGIYWTKKAAEQGYNGSLFNLGYCYETGLGVNKDLSKAIHYYKEALEKGYHQAGERLKKLQNN